MGTPGPAGHPGASVAATRRVLDLPPEPGAVPAARRMLRELLQMSGHDEWADPAELACTELVTNAVLHARSAIELGITVADHSVVVTVHDEDLTRPEQQPYEGREGGWGLGLVRELSAASSLVKHPGDGKTAWFRLPRTGGPTGRPGSAARAQSGFRTSTA